MDARRGAWKECYGGRRRTLSQFSKLVRQFCRDRWGRSSREDATASLVRKARPGADDGTTYADESVFYADLPDAGHESETARRVGTLRAVFGFLCGTYCMKTTRFVNICLSAM